MKLSPSIFINLIVSEPLVIGLALLRTFVCIYRSHRAKQLKFTIFAILIAVVLILIFSAIVIVLFAYGVAHTGKSAEADLIILTGTLVFSYTGSFLAWWATARMDKSLNKNVI